MKALSLIAAAGTMLGSALAAWQPEEVPDDIRKLYVESNTVISETPCDWRDTVEKIFRPAVEHCNSPREAVLYIAANMTNLTGVYYSIERRRADMNALEALEEKKVSCSAPSAFPLAPSASPPGTTSAATTPGRRFGSTVSGT